MVHGRANTTHFKSIVYDNDTASFNVNVSQCVYQPVSGDSMQGYSIVKNRFGVISLFVYIQPL